MTATKKTQALVLTFKSDTFTGVSRDTLRALAKKLGFSETQTIHFALARLGEDARQADLQENYLPLTKGELAALRKHEPKRRGRVISTLLSSYCNTNACPSLNSVIEFSTEKGLE